MINFRSKVVLYVYGCILIEFNGYLLSNTLLYNSGDISCWKLIFVKFHVFDQTLLRSLIYRIKDNFYIQSDFICIWMYINRINGYLSSNTLLYNSGSISCWRLIFVQFHVFDQTLVRSLIYRINDNFYIQSDFICIWMYINSFKGYLSSNTLLYNSGSISWWRLFFVKFHDFDQTLVRSLVYKINSDF